MVVVVVPVVVCCLLYAFITICFSLDINVVLFLLSDIFFIYKVDNVAVVIVLACGFVSWIPLVKFLLV